MEIFEQVLNKIKAKMEASTPQENQTFLPLKPKAIEKLRKEHPEYFLTETPEDNKNAT